ncbi:PLDc N-terminal domain-containing protein [Hanstruepera flava]|uniref:PLDc N-terminal domain-containing protein n=1 Tax=Hanstruepera flava TaxID=2930218 RepID=UPI00202984FB|nr:PLDc N-terminal domain-containing protein [Hanstruepera flava]
MMIFLAIGIWQIILIFTILSLLLLPILALISIVSKTFPNNDKLIWVLVVLFLPLLGSVLYFLIGRPRQKAFEIRNSKQNYIKY